MNQEYLLELKRRFLKKTLNESLLKKHYVEMNISEQFEQLKKLEVTLEKIRATRDQNLQLVHP